MDYGPKNDNTVSFNKLSRDFVINGLTFIHLFGSNCFQHRREKGKEKEKHKRNSLCPPLVHKAVSMVDPGYHVEVTP